MNRLLLTAIVAAGVFASVSAQPCTLAHSDVEALDVETIVAEHTLWRSPGHLPHAKDVVDQFAGVREYVQSAYGVDPDYFVAMLDEEDWNLVRDAKPGCLDAFGISKNFFDLGVMATPADADVTFQACRSLVETLGPAGATQLAAETGMVTDSTCYRMSTSSWVPMYAALLVTHYFENLNEEQVAWPARLVAQVLATDVLRNTHPELAELRSIASRTFAESLQATGGPPDVRAYEAGHAAWQESDVEQFAAYTYWFESLAFHLVDQFGASFASALRDLLADGVVPADSEGWLAVFEALDPGLWSVLTEVYSSGEIPATLLLEPTFPNPFTGSTTVIYTQAAASPVTLRLFDVTGRAVWFCALGWMPAGRHEATLNAGSLPAGTYLLRIDSGSSVRSRPVTLVR